MTPELFSKRVIFRSLTATDMGDRGHRGDMGDEVLTSKNIYKRNMMDEESWPGLNNN